MAEMARREPETLAALRAALDGDTASIVGGEFGEEALPLLAPESILADVATRTGRLRGAPGPSAEHLRRGGDSGCRPCCRASSRSSAFKGACHFTLDAGRFPTGNQSKVRWEGLDAATLESLARVPLDASRHDTFLKLPERLGRVDGPRPHGHGGFRPLAGQVEPMVRRPAADGPVFARAWDAS